MLWERKPVKSGHVDIATGHARDDVWSIRELEVETVVIRALGYGRDIDYLGVKIMLDLLNLEIEIPVSLKRAFVPADQLK